MDESARDVETRTEAAAGRDRDEAGRARSARPRDELGRPLPYGAPGVPSLPDDVTLSPDEALTEAQRLLDKGRPFQAHEVLEAAWKASPEAERELWQGLAQLAVGLTHARRGNLAGAATLLRRGSATIESYAEDAPYDVDVRGLMAWVDTTIGRLDADPTSLGPPRLRER